MAQQADGSIIVDTELDTQKFQAGSAEMHRAVKSLAGTVKSLGPTFQKALSGSESAASTFNAKAAALEDTIAELQEKLRGLENARVPTDDFQWLTTEIEKANSQLNALEDKQAKMRDTGVKTNSQAWKSLQYDIDLAKQKIAEYKAEQAYMRENGTAFQMGSSTAEYQRLNAELSEAQGKLAAMRSEAAKTGSESKSFVGKIVSGLRSALSHTAKLISSNKKYKDSFKGLVSKARSFAVTLLGARTVYSLLRKAVSAYMSSNEELSNTLSSCWTSIGNLLGPIIQRIVSLLASAVSYLTTFLKMLGLTGSAASKAINSAGGSASKATEKLKRQLASFDDLNVLSGNESDSGGGGGADVAAALPEATLPDWSKLMIEQLKNGEWAKAAKTLTAQLNKMISSVDWGGIGDKIGYYFNGALDFLATAVTTFDWYNLGASLATLLNHIITGVDWKNLGKLLGGSVMAVINSIGGFFAKVDWKALGKALADAFTGLWNSIDWGKAAKTISDGVKGVLTGISSAIKNVDWGKLGTDLWNSLVDIVTNIDWGGLISTAFDLLGAAIGGAASLVIGFATAFWDSLCSAFDTIKTTYFEPYFNDMGQMTIKGFFQGIWDMLCDIGNWIYNNIFLPFINGFKAAFGIHSPSTVMSEMGGFLIEGLYNGIKNAWQSITGFFSGALSTIKTTLSNAWDNIKTTADQKWSAIKTSLSTVWEGVKTTASTKWGNLKTTISTAWDNIKTTASQKWSAIKTSLSTAWDNIKTTASTKWDNIKSTINNKGWSGIGSNIASGIGAGIDSGWSWLKSKVSSVASSLLSAAKSALGIHSPSRVFRDTVGLNIGLGIGEGIEDSEQSVVKTVNGVAGAIAEEFAENDYSISPIAVDNNGNITRSLNSFSDKITNSFSTLLERLEAIASSVTFAIPSVAYGAVPYSAAGSANAGGGSHISEAAIDELTDIVIQCFSNTTSTLVRAIESNNGDVNINLDSNSLATSVIKEINRRTRMFGASPLVD